MRFFYWSDSRFAKWLKTKVGIHVDNSVCIPIEQLHENQQQERQQRQQHRVLYWLTDDFLDILQDVVYWPRDMLHRICRYLSVRFVERPHVLDTKLKRGEYYEIDYRILCGLFETLVDFIEVECAWHNCVCDSKARKKFNPPWWGRWLTWRSKQAGIDYLRWEMTLTNNDGTSTSQAQSATEQMELYIWWTQTRPNRPDPDYEVTQILDKIGSPVDWTKVFSNDYADKEKFSQASRRASEITQQYMQQDTEMLIRLINIRHSLWT